ncbi:hypothetical protein ARMSODRAFT_218254 [Armillaria solidipes]|uniref:Uncharacterized protein n=1 Tax=Armillaria solidipes TaxID=1076256 RepID=A0A2H3CLQ5_9AGAR|nr:hypothetical protein ARMSODRAFT_218254 [Armillaria solidipes]
MLVSYSKYSDHGQHRSMLEGEGAQGRLPIFGVRYPHSLRHLFPWSDRSLNRPPARLGPSISFPWLQYHIGNGERTRLRDYQAGPEVSVAFHSSLHDVLVKGSSLLLVERTRVCDRPSPKVSEFPIHHHAFPEMFIVRLDQHFHDSLLVGWRFSRFMARRQRQSLTSRCDCARSLLTHRMMVQAAARRAGLGYSRGSMRSTICNPDFTIIYFLVFPEY